MEGAHDLRHDERGERECPSWVDAVEKGFAGVALACHASKGFLDPVPERNSDSPRAHTRNWILSVHHTISRMIDFFNSIGQTRRSTRASVSVRLPPEACPTDFFEAAV
jgi:hypothetical protein